MWLSIILYLYRYQTTQSTKDLLQCPLCYFIINFQYKLSEANLLLLWQNWGGKTERISNSISTTFFFYTFPSMFVRGILNALYTCKHKIRYTRYTRFFHGRQVFHYYRIIVKRVEECPCNIACNLDKVIWQSCVPNHYLIISFNFAGLRYNLSSSISQQHQPGLIPTVSAPGNLDSRPVGSDT